MVMTFKNKKLALLLLSAVLAGSLALPAASAASAESRKAAANPSESVSTEKPDSAAEEQDGAQGEVSVQDAKMTKSKAEELVRKYVSIPKEYKLVSSRMSTEKLSNGVRHMWYLEFNKTVNGKHQGSISTSINAVTGQLYGFSTYTNNPSAKPVYPLKVDREAAEKLAEKFIADLAPDYGSHAKLHDTYGVPLLPPLSGEVYHQFLFERVVNGIAFPSNHIRITIDSEGHLTNYSLQWDDTIEFPAPGRTLTSQEAEAAVKKAAQPQLTYILPYRQDGGKLEPVLSYELAPFAIDAATGEKLSDNYYSRAEKLSDKPLSDKPLGTKPKAAPLTEEQAIQKVREAFGLPEGIELTGSSLNERENEQGQSVRSWSLNWELKTNGKSSGYMYANVDGNTGVIESFNRYYYDEKQQSSQLTLEQAVATAEAAVKKQLPWLADSLYLNTADHEEYKQAKPEDIYSYYFTFRHKVNGALAEYDRIRVSVNARTGEIENYYSSILPYDYPAELPKVIGGEAAVAKWLDYYSIQLNYRLSEDYWWNGGPLPIEKYKLMLASGEIAQEDVDYRAKVELVYRLAAMELDESVFLDAATGEWRNRESGAATALEKPTASDIAGHWAEEPLKLMVAYKALDLKEGEVRPSQKITRGELIKMLVLARSEGRFYGYAMAAGDSGSAVKEMAFRDVAADSDLFAYVQSALQQNLIDIGDGSFEPDAHVTRDEMAELIVRALGYNTLANHDHIFRSDFKDSASIENKGQAAIAVGLNIMSLTDGKFLPGKEVTRAEAAIAFYRYLQKRAELQEAPLRM